MILSLFSPNLSVCTESWRGRTPVLITPFLTIQKLDVLNYQWKLAFIDRRGWKVKDFVPFYKYIRVSLRPIFQMYLLLRCLSWRRSCFSLVGGKFLGFQWGYVSFIKESLLFIERHMKRIFHCMNNIWSLAIIDLGK